MHSHGIEPVIQNRALWLQQGDQEKMLLGGRYPLHLVYDEAGTVHCYDRSASHRCDIGWPTSARNTIASV